MAKPGGFRGRIRSFFNRPETKKPKQEKPKPTIAEVPRRAEGVFRPGQVIPFEMNVFGHVCECAVQADNNFVRVLVQVKGKPNTAAGDVFTYGWIEEVFGKGIPRKQAKFHRIVQRTEKPDFDAAFGPNWPNVTEAVLEEAIRRKLIKPSPTSRSNIIDSQKAKPAE